MIRRYFENEMRYLDEAGRAFAEAHPEQAGMLNLTDTADRDPYVERLLEGFAFLAARIHQRLDDELPEYTEGLFSLLYPAFLRPFPSCAMVAFTPKQDQVLAKKKLSRGTELRSDRVGEERIQCRFVTTRDVDLYPFQLVRVESKWTGGKSQVMLYLDLFKGVRWDTLDLDRLRLYFHGDPALAATLTLFFSNYVDRVTVEGLTDERTVLEEPLVLPGKEALRPGGLADEEALLQPEPMHPGQTGDTTFPIAMSGYRLLQEYLCFRPKFWCVDVVGLQRYQPQAPIEGVKITFHFDRAIPEEKSFGKDNIELFAGPIINLFENDAAPLRVDHKSNEYFVTPDNRYRKSIEIYDVLEVVGSEEKSNKRHTYYPFYSFAHAGSDQKARFFKTHVQQDDTSTIHTSLSFEGPFLKEGYTPTPETMSIKTRATNGTVPRSLTEGMIRTCAPGTPNLAYVKNLTRPTQVYYPPRFNQADLYWKMISHFSFSFLSVAQKEALTGLLTLYNWPDTRENQRRIEGIKTVRWEPIERLYRGMIVRGAEVVMDVQEDHFVNEGDLWIFGQVMQTFFSMYATINSFVHLKLQMHPSEKVFQWQPRIGGRPLL